MCQPRPLTDAELEAISRFLEERAPTIVPGARRGEPDAVEPVATASDPIFEAWRAYQRGDKPMRDLARGLGIQAPALWKAFKRRGLQTREVGRRAA